jgi:hypothetical protein
VTSVTPNSGSASGGTSVTISGTGFLAGASVSIGGTAATNVNVTNGTSLTAVTPAHATGTVNVVVINTDGQSGLLAGGFTFVAAAPGDIVMYASEATRVGNYLVVSDGTAAGGARLHNPDAGAAKLVSALANPASYFELSFTAQGGTAYRLWVRGKAQDDSPYNDSFFVQFSDSVNAAGGAVSRIGTTGAESINLEDCFGCGLSGWGWQDNGWGVGVLGPLIYFQNSGQHTIRIHYREDGLSLDQLVLSPTTYLNTAPGAVWNDSTILPKTNP